MHFKDLVDRMSSEFNMPAADAKKIAKFVLDQFAELIEKKEDFNSIYNQTLQTNASLTTQPTTFSIPIIECYSILASNLYFSYNYTKTTVCLNTNYCTYQIEV